MRKPRQTTIRVRTTDELEELAERATYVGSPEHKLGRWWGGLPQGRQLPGGRVGRRRKQHTTPCPLYRRSDQVRATKWVRNAIRAGQCRFYESDLFPKRIWYEADGEIWIGLRVTDGLGEYKGWPGDEEERDETFGRMD